MTHSIDESSRRQIHGRVELIQGVDQDRAPVKSEPFLCLPLHLLPTSESILELNQNILVPTGGRRESYN